MRKIRHWFPGAKYHITCRGIRKSDLFFEKEDYLRYLEIIHETKQVYPFHLQAYCLMTNHTHLQVQTIDTSPSLFMKKINTAYAKFFNWKYEFSGHVFEKRYGAELIDSLDYEKDVSKYIHVNPVKAGMARDPEDYPWSSCRAYFCGEQPPLISTNQLLSYFPNPYFHSYEEFVKAPFIDHTILPALESDLCGPRYLVLG